MMEKILEIMKFGTIVNKMPGILYLLTVEVRRAGIYMHKINMLLWINRNVIQSKVTLKLPKNPKAYKQNIQIIYKAINFLQFL